MIIVTGGAGMIGSNIIKALNEENINDILVVDDLKNGIKFVNLVDLKIIDYIDKEDFIIKITAGNDFDDIDIDAVFHEGACSSTTEWNGKYMMDNNYQYSKKLLHFCLDRKIPFLYASSAAIYSSRNSSFTEENAYEQPLNIYGYSKMLFDQYVLRILPKARSQVCGLRYFNVYGPREGHKGSMASVAFHLNKQMNNGENPKLFEGSDNFKRDFIHVRDVVSVNLWLWKSGISDIFNCGTGRSESFQVVAKATMNYHKKGLIEYIPFPNELWEYYQTYTKADLTKLRAAGYDKPFQTVDEGIADYMIWLNRDA